MEIIFRCVILICIWFSIGVALAVEPELETKYPVNYYDQNGSLVCENLIWNQGLDVYGEGTIQFENGSIFQRKYVSIPKKFKDNCNDDIFFTNDEKGYAWVYGKLMNGTFVPVPAGEEQKGIAQCDHSMLSNLFELVPGFGSQYKTSDELDGYMECHTDPDQYEKYLTEYKEIVEQVADSFLIDPTFLKCKLFVESGWNSGSVSSTGVKGLGMLVETTLSDIEKYIDEIHNGEGKKQARDYTTFMTGYEDVYRKFKKQREEEGEAYGHMTAFAPLLQKEMERLKSENIVNYYSVWLDMLHKYKIMCEKTTEEEQEKEAVLNNCDKVDVRIEEYYDLMLRARIEKDLKESMKSIKKQFGITKMSEVDNINPTKQIISSAAYLVLLQRRLLASGIGNNVSDVRIENYVKFYSVLGGAYNAGLGKVSDELLAKGVRKGLGNYIDFSEVKPIGQGWYDKLMSSDIDPELRNHMERINICMSRGQNCFSTDQNINPLPQCRLPEEKRVCSSPL